MATETSLLGEAESLVHAHDPPVGLQHLAPQLVQPEFAKGPVDHQELDISADAAPPDGGLGKVIGPGAAAVPAIDVVEVGKAHRLAVHFDDPVRAARIALDAGEPAGVLVRLDLVIGVHVGGHLWRIAPCQEPVLVVRSESAELDLGGDHQMRLKPPAPARSGRSRNSRLTSSDVKAGSPG